MISKNDSSFGYEGIETSYQDTTYYYKNGFSKDDAFDKEYIIDFDPIVSIGYGRIEELKNLKRAIHILEDLMKLDQLSRKVNDKDIKKLADLLTELDRESVFDKRDKKRYALEKIDQLLYQSNLIKVRKIQYFTSLEDMWRYGSETMKDGFKVELVSRGLSGYEYVDKDVKLNKFSIKEYIYDDIFESEKRDSDINIDDEDYNYGLCCVFKLQL